MNCYACNTDVNKLQERIAELEREIAALNESLTGMRLNLVGFTNGDQIEYAKEESGSFYPTNEMNCYIPLYMLKIHEHRIETTKIENEDL